MRLMNARTLSLANFLGNDVPRYAILSHTWGLEEVLFHDILEGSGKDKDGFHKILFCGLQAVRDGLEYFWIDTCCIDRSNHTELQEAINSMFSWTRNAARCYVYLSDVSTRNTYENEHFSWEFAFEKSRWFTRGWTLQELLAPRTVEFFSREHNRLGDKKSLEQQLHEITGIAISALRGSPLSQFSVAERISWMEGRFTTLEEDQAYCLLGLFDIQMPLLYGEGKESAFRRLHKEIENRSKNRQSDKLSTDLQAFTTLTDRPITAKPLVRSAYSPPNDERGAQDNIREKMDRENAIRLDGYNRPFRTGFRNQYYLPLEATPEAPRSPAQNNDPFRRPNEGPNSVFGPEHRPHERPIHQGQDPKNHDRRTNDPQFVDMAVHSSSDIPFPRNPNFVSHGTILDQIQQKCSIPGSWTALVGVCGIGKTQLAVELAYRIRELSPVTRILWVNASGLARFEQSYPDTVDHLGMAQWRGREASIFKIIQDWILEEKKGKWILIIDNVNDPGFFSSPETGEDLQQLSTYLSRNRNGSILITTRDPGLQPTKELVKIYVEPMEESDALRLFEKMGIQGDSNDISQLVATLLFMPLAIVNAAERIRSTKISVRKYLELYLESVRKNNTVDNSRTHINFESSLSDCGSSDNVSALPSVFSLQSILSTANTGNTVFNQAEIKRATDEIISIFLDDRELEPLYRVAMDDKRIGPERFSRNFRRLLKVFSLDLKEEARDSSDIELANLVSSKAGFVTAGIRRILKPPEFAGESAVERELSPSRFSTNDHSIEDGFSGGVDMNWDEEPEEANNEAFAALVAQGRRFIEESIAFKNLRDEFRSFVMALPQRIPRLQPTNHHTEASGDNERRAVRSKLQPIFNNALEFLSSIGLIENGILPGHRRISWTNSVGKKLYDDYIEHETGALQALQDYLRASAYISKATPDSGESRTSTHSISILTSNNGAARAGSSESSNFADQVQKTLSESIEDNRVQSDIELGQTPPRVLYLFCCVEKGRYGFDLHRELLTDVLDDRQLFRALRDSYDKLKGKFRPYWSLRTMGSIHFMKFVYGSRRYIDVRCHYDICELGKSCKCLPPNDLVVPIGTEYECRPVPSKLSPPIGPRLLMDFFTNPETIEKNNTMVMEQLPKRISGELQSSSSDLTEAWGIFYKEDWDWNKIWWILTIIFFLGSLLFAILWVILKKDIQGAFGVSAWWMSGAAILIGIVGTYSWAP